LKEITLKPALAMASVLNRSALTRIPSTFTLGEAVGAITEDLVRKAGGSKTQIEKAVQRQLKSLRARRVDLSSPVKQDFLLMIDQEEFEKLASKINRTQNFAELLEKRGKLGRMHLPFVKEQQAANFAALHGTAKLVTPAEHRAATLERWRVSVDNIAPPMKAGGLPALCAAVQVWMVTDSWKTLKTVTPETALVTYGRFASGVAGVLGSAVEAYGAFRESILSAKLSPKVAIDNAAMIKRAGKAIGGFAGGATAIFDFMEMGGAIKAGQNGMASLYFISGLTGSASFFIFFIGSREALKQTAIRLGAGFLLGGPIAWALLIISVGVSLAIIINKDDPLQEWLGKTPFGKRDDGFNSLEDQLKAMTELSSTTQ
ncbi:MAG: hypothetical protein LBG61_02060, partial [Burkholderiales bacterium]|nr:hypothetical protein [Burkholderiales bacterium]